ncbi:sensor histidine kinase [Parapedobacter lycopersici]|uniref:sensor histidine kinase n=1 Tax=Parapedobacter lycopersici TaxID=1864939 RepID=UPI00214DAF4B|nr:ATP-binding protein [Parapedobacter lycopersici]
MKAKSRLPQRSFYFFIVFFLLLAIQNQIAAGQSVTQAQEEFEQLDQAYYADRISADKYLDSVNRLTDQHLSEGIHFKTQELADVLSLFKEIAWSEKAYGHYRKNYYVIFLNNASMFEETGAAMYYAEKVNQEYKRNGEKSPLIEASTKSQIYMEEELYDKVIAQYIKEKPYLETLPKLLLKNEIDIPTGTEALTILSAGVIDSYIKTGDTAAVYQTAQLINEIGNAIKLKRPVNRQYMLFNDFFMLVTKYYIALFEGEQDKVGGVLDSLAALKTAYHDQATGFINQNLFPWRIDHYLAIKNTDSAGVYIKKYETSPLFVKNQQAKVNEYKAMLRALQGDLHGSNKWLSLALADERKAQAKLMAEMTDLLYAYTEAENTKIDLQQSEAVKRQRTSWLMVISFASVLIVLAIYLTMLHRSRKAKAQIAALNEAANIQIIAMEEAKHQAVRDEQKRLGQDLHDGLSSSIAAIRNQLELLSMDTEDIVLRSKLGRLQSETANVYEVARRKSHKWFNEADEQEVSFEKQIRLLTDNALPDNRYNKTIHIDDNSLANVNTDTKIALFRIIQEAITNIIKHARAKNIDILVYQDEASLILTISDDGVGLDKKKFADKKTTIGLASIRRRVQYLNGKTNIHSSTEGTEIIVSIPLIPL